jgi:predicted phage-related endonuclease
MIMKEELDAEIEAAQDAIKAEMTARDAEEMIVDVFKFDTTAFKKAHEDIYKLFTKATESRRFSIA